MSDVTKRKVGRPAIYTPEQRRLNRNAQTRKWQKSPAGIAYHRVASLRRYHLEKEKIRAQQNTPERRARRANYQRIYSAQRRERDVNFRFRQNLRNRIRSAVMAQGSGKSGKTAELTGCSIPMLRAWLQLQFKPGMTWENYGAWHIDHRIPCVEFDLRDPRQQRQCFHYTNLQPLWGIENVIKGAKVVYDSQNRQILTIEKKNLAIA